MADAYAVGQARQGNVFRVPAHVAQRFVRLPDGVDEVMVKKVYRNRDAVRIKDGMEPMGELEAIRTFSRKGFGPTVYGMVDCQDAVLVLMEALPGQPLIEYMQIHQGTIPKAIKDDIFAGIHRMAQAGLYHDDLNFDNIFVNPVNFLDFGKSAVIDYDAPNQDDIKANMEARMIRGFNKFLDANKQYF